MSELTIWRKYCEHFDPYCRVTRLRKGCEPKVITRRGATKSMVLTHGLSDSPYYMADIANFFADQLGYNVYLPLLHCHGLKKPAGMESVELEEWKRNVRWAVDQAHLATPGHVSVGGLSTGGALSFYMACTSQKVTGDLYLLSAALGLNAIGSSLAGKILQNMLRSRKLVDFLDHRDADKPLIGNNPFKYAYVDKDGAYQLARLIRELDGLIDDFSRKQPFTKRVFAAHSHADDTASIDAIKKLQRRTKVFVADYIPAKKAVTHGGLTLKADVRADDGTLCTPANAVWNDMMSKVRQFAH